MKTKTLKTRQNGPAAARRRAQAVVSAAVRGTGVSDREDPDGPQRRESPELWGLLTSIDIYHCDPAAIRDADRIKRFVAELCDLIEMRRFGETLVVHFGEEERVAGYSMVQLIETSLISAHFANASNAVYLDVFSCKMYDPEVVAQFARRYFGGSRVVTHITPRR
jgi:S-adenosylmethionine/arginine decarboxylase-like enzyme